MGPPFILLKYRWIKVVSLGVFLTFIFFFDWLRQGLIILYNVCEAVAEWLKVPDCKSVEFLYVGSNPTGLIRSYDLAGKIN